MSDKSFSLPTDHPIVILMAEHETILGSVASLVNLSRSISFAPSVTAAEAEIQHVLEITQRLRAAESHYTREENVLFPLLERHGIADPPARMWNDHAQIRELEQGLLGLVEERESESLLSFGLALEESGKAIAMLLENHFGEENGVLFPTALRALSEEEWTEVRKRFDEIGYGGLSGATRAEPLEDASGIEAGVLRLSTGTLSVPELEAILETLPADITFANADDLVRYFNRPSERGFPRADAVLGRDVRLCHPEESLHLVDRILREFHEGSLDRASFWSNDKERLVLSRYFALRRKGRYIGCLEVDEDVTDIRSLEGEGTTL